MPDANVMFELSQFVQSAAGQNRERIMSGIGWSHLSQSSTGNQNIDGILSGSKWAQENITFSFPTSNTVFASNYQNATPTNNFAPVTEQMKVAARFALDANSGPGGASFSIEALTNLNIAETSDAKTTLRFAQSNTPSTAFAYYPGTGYDEAGDVWFGRNYTYTNPTPGTYAWHTMLHEIGHAVGLKHGQETNVYGAVPANRDAMEYTVMTYRSYIGDPLSGGYSNEQYGYAQSYMMLDIAALQNMYGADYTVNSGDTVYKWNPGSGDTLINGQVAIAAGGNRIFATIWDGGGVDTYDLSSYTTGVSIDLRPGESSLFSTTQRANLGDGQVAAGNIYNALLFGGNNASLIENVIGGSGNDTIRGNDGANAIYGGAGNDTLYGHDGNDMLVGGAGNDFLDGGAGEYDIVSYYDSLGAVTVKLDIGTANDGFGAVDTLINIETVYGSSHSDYILGDTQNNVLAGFGGNDVIYGAGGHDYLSGGDGNDFINGGAGYDTIDGGAGFDTADYSNAPSGVFVELWQSRTTNDGSGGSDTLIGIEAVQGSLHSDVLIGDTQNNFLAGLSGNDTIYAGWGDDLIIGGAGSDYLFGDLGNDIFDVYASEFAAGVWDIIPDFSESSGNFDAVRLVGLTRSQVDIFDYNGGVFITPVDLNYSGGIFIENFNTSRLQDQLFFL